MKKFLALLIAAGLTVFTYLDGLEEVSEPNEMLESTRVYFIDVDQGDSSLILSGDDAILIDGGKNSCEELLVDFINEQGISSIDLIIATHPHEDHIGGLDAVIDNFDVSQILMGRVPANTKTYEDVVASANNSGTEIIYPDDFDSFVYDSGLTINLLNPSEDFESSNTNDDSIVCEVNIGETSILYTGDMEVPLEKELMWQFNDVDILKVGHHGSTTSSCEEFLDKVKPEIAIISCGVDNSYGHPHDEITERLLARDIEIRRTDLEGDILYEFD